MNWIGLPSDSRDEQMIWKYFGSKTETTWWEEMEGKGKRGIRVISYKFFALTLVGRIFSFGTSIVNIFYLVFRNSWSWYDFNFVCRLKSQKSSACILQNNCFCHLKVFSSFLKSVGMLLNPTCSHRFHNAELLSLVSFLFFFPLNEERKIQKASKWDYYLSVFTYWNFTWHPFSYKNWFSDYKRFFI